MRWSAVLQVLLEVGAAAGALLAISGVVGMVLKLRPLVREAVHLLGQIRDASGGVQQLAVELRELAAAFVAFAIANTDKIEENSRRLGDMAELYTDLDATVHRLERAVTALLGRRVTDDAPKSDT